MGPTSKSSSEFICIHCGAQIKELCKKYSSTVLKLVNCENCEDVADKYVEYDPIIVIIDLILLRKEAYRHILYNTEFKSHWKLAVMLQMMEIYSEWTSISPKLKSDLDPPMYTADVQLYLLSMRIFFRTMGSMLTIFLLTTLYNLLFKESRSKISLKVVWKAIMLSNFGWFLLLPSLIWDNSAQESHLIFVSLYTTLSQLLAYTVVCNCIKIWSVIVIILSYHSKVLSNEAFDALSNFCADLVY